MSGTRKALMTHSHDQKESAPVIAAPALLIGTVVFVAGAVVMVLELVGSRLLAPYFGNSLFVWTSLIGVMLGFMALGGFLGGRLADRHLSVKVLFWILLGASLSISLVSFAETALLSRLAQQTALRVAAVTSATILFAVPSTLLGMVSPYCTRLRLHALADSGATVGSLYALSTIGSIVGTFAAGFWLIARIGSHDLVAWLAAAVFVLAAPLAFPFSVRRAAALVAALALLIGAMYLSRTSESSFDTEYDRYFISHEIEAETLRPVATLARDYQSIESATYIDNGEPFMLDYYRYYDLALSSVPQVERTLLIGGGAFSYPRHQLTQYPESVTDVVEIDPTLVEVARTEFSLEEDPRMNIAVQDGRMFLNRSRESYDVILIDAFKSASSIPYQLTTYEAMSECYRLLDDDGVVAMNLIASRDGAGSRFLWAEYVTLKAIFPQVEVFAVHEKEDGEFVQNISIIASKSESAKLVDIVPTVAPELASQRLTYRPDDLDTIPLITDDFAPVDQYLMNL